MFLKLTKIFSLILNSLLGLCVTVDEGYETEENLGAKVCLQKFCKLYLSLFKKA